MYLDWKVCLHTAGKQLRITMSDNSRDSSCMPVPGSKRPVHKGKRKALRRNFVKRKERWRRSCGLDLTGRMLSDANKSG